MKTLADVLLSPPQGNAVAADAVRLIEAQVAGRGGLRGLSLKTGLSVLKAARPGILDRAVRHLLPEFARALDPLYQEFRSSSDRDFSVFLRKHSGRATQALLAVADGRVREASPTVQSAYARLRGIAESEVETALPAVARLVGAYAD